MTSYTKGLITGAILGISFDVYVWKKFDLGTKINNLLDKHTNRVSSSKETVQLIEKEVELNETNYIDIGRNANSSGPEDDIKSVSDILNKEKYVSDQTANELSTVSTESEETYNLVNVSKDTLDKLSADPSFDVDLQNNVVHYKSNDMEEK